MSETYLNYIYNSNDVSPQEIGRIVQEVGNYATANKCPDIVLTTDFMSFLKIEIPEDSNDEMYEALTMFLYPHAYKIENHQYVMDRKVFDEAGLRYPHWLNRKVNNLNKDHPEFRSFRGHIYRLHSVDT